MGCVFSSIYEEEKVRTCKERKKLMKQLVNIRGEFSDSQLAYLKALKNTGATLRQFTESESLDLETCSNGLVVPPSPPPPLPPSPPPPPPPPPPPFSLDEKSKGKIPQEESLENDEHHIYTMLSQQNFKSPLDYIFSSPSPQCEIEEDENWAETRTDFVDEEDPEAETIAKPQDVEQAGESSYGMRLRTKDTTDMHMVISRNKKTLEGIIKELDDFFLKASAGVREIAVLIDMNGRDFLLRQNSRDQKRNSAKVFSVLSWSRHSKSTQFTRDDAEFFGPSEPCKPGAHCLTLKKLYAAEKKLCKALKEEEITKLEYQRKSLLLQRQEDENADWIKIDKTRSSVESLESDVARLQQSISETTSTILALIDEELYPQLVALTSGLTQMWRTMFECHQAQTRICKQLSYLNDNQSTMLNSEYHHQATIQLETEVTYWYNSFCKLAKSQQEYVRTLCKWITHTNCLMDDHEQSGCSRTIRRISEQWENGLDQLPDKVVSDAIKSLLLSISNIIGQQAEEDNLLKKLGKLERKLEKESSSLAEMERKTEWSFDAGDIPENLSPHHPLSLKHAKTEALKKQVESEKAKYMDSVQVTRAITLSNLKTKLPQVFQSLMAFSGAYAQALEAVHSQVKPAVECSDIAPQN